MHLEVAIHVGGVRNSAFKEDQGEENLFICSAGHLCASGVFCSSASQARLVPPWPVLGIKPPPTWKNRLQCLRRLPGYTERVFRDGVGFVQLSVLVPL